ncbi:hypothetical protein [Desulfitobacterium sp.]|uniref:hypothetical protein n=1 Tax=Desulfitobacterium sp. TaxID=49981 RepID=UPI002B7201CB|nr:hypothetical protein [Desulfitobacterium sp.]HVJ50001.1 hypothetical protein [Desulfitobacterium sp.]
MIKTKSLAVLALLILIVVATGCQRQVDKSGQSAIPASSGDNSARHIQRKLDTNLSVDAEVIAPSTIQKLNTYLVAPLKLDTQVQTLKTLLIANSQITQKKELDGTVGNAFFRTIDGKYLGVGSKSVYFETANFQPYIYQILFRYITPGNTTYNLDRFSQNQALDLPFMPYRQAEDKVIKELASLGISAYDEVETYSLDYKTLQAQEKAMKEKGDLTSPKDGSITLKDRWSAEDDLFFIIFRSSLDNIPVYPLDHGNVENNTIVQSGYIYAAYSQKGLEFLKIDSSYQKKAVDQEGLKIISAEQALAAVARKYGNVILTDPITITAIELYYVPTLIRQSRDEFRMVPSWSFKLEQVVKDAKGQPLTVNNRIIIDATTGGEIL